MSKWASWRGHAVIGFAVRTYLALVFLFACIHKILVPEDFAVDVATYEILPIVLVNPTAIAMPFVEAAAGLLLLVGFRTKGAALLIALMMLVFTAAVSIALAKGLNMSCGCFASKGAALDPISWKTIFRDSGWLLLSMYIFVFEDGVLGVDGLLRRHRAKRDHRIEHKERQS